MSRIDESFIILTGMILLFSFMVSLAYFSYKSDIKASEARAECIKYTNKVAECSLVFR